MVLRRASASQAENGRGVEHGPPAPDEFVDRFPSLVEFLSAEKYEDGSAREPGTLLLVWQDGRWRAWLNDRGVGDAAWLSSHGLSSLLASVEAGLAEGSLEWRRQRPRGKQK